VKTDRQTKCGLHIAASLCLSVCLSVGVSFVLVQEGEATDGSEGHRPGCVELIARCDFGLAV